MGGLAGNVAIGVRWSRNRGFPHGFLIRNRWAAGGRRTQKRHVWSYTGYRDRMEKPRAGSALSRSLGMTRVARTGYASEDISSATKCWGAFLPPPLTTSCALSYWRLRQRAGTAPLGKSLPRRLNARLSLGRHWRSTYLNVSFQADSVSWATRRTSLHRWWAPAFHRAFSTGPPLLTPSADQGALPQKQVPERSCVTTTFA